jgi:hypothetical protein
MFKLEEIKHLRRQSILPNSQTLQSRLQHGQVGVYDRCIGISAMSQQLSDRKPPLRLKFFWRHPWITRQTT